MKAEIEKVQDFYPYAEIPIYVIMPDHVHLITKIRKTDAMNTNTNTNTDAINRVPTGGITGKKNPMLNATLGTVVRGLKARVTQFARQNNIPFKWQPRYHDRIIRNRDEMNKIAKYIELNPAKWESQYSLNRV